MKFLMICTAVALTGCSDTKPSESIKTDQCMRREIFQQCMVSLPKGPDRVGTSNNWDDVVHACDSTAYRQSQRLASQIETKCVAP